LRCLSLWQPWAQLVVLGVKRFETRSWATSHRGPLLIQASSRRPLAPGATHPKTGFPLVELEAIYARLEREGVAGPEALQTGALVGLVHVVGCHRAEDLEPLHERVGVEELMLGDFSSGRFAWKLERAAPFDQALEYPGGQRLFNVPAVVSETRAGRVLVRLHP